MSEQAKINNFQMPTELRLLLILSINELNTTSSLVTINKINTQTKKRVTD